MIAAALYLIATVSHAADPQPYSVNFDNTGNAQLDKLLQDASILIRLQESTDAGPFALIARTKQDQERFVAAMQSLGYYKGKSLLRIAGLMLDAPDLFDNLANTPAGTPVVITAAFELGPQFHLGQIKLEGDIPQQAHDSLKLKTADKAVATDVLAARERLLNAIREQGYPLAKIDEPLATVQETTDTVDLLFRVDSGPKADLGKITVNGLKELNEDFLRRRLLISSGQLIVVIRLKTWD